jgi:hypothetical protein
MLGVVVFQVSQVRVRPVQAPLDAGTFGVRSSFFGPVGTSCSGHLSRVGKLACCVVENPDSKAALRSSTADGLFKEDGSLESPAYATVVHNHTALLGPMIFRGLPTYSPHGPKGPILLQDHGIPVRFRNVWVRTVKGHDEG